MKKYYFLCLILLYSCASIKEKSIVIVNENDAIKNAINDFLFTESKLLKDDKTFFVNTKNIEDMIGVSIIGDPNSILLQTSNIIAIYSATVS